jgi:hypothetical protein
MWKGTIQSDGSQMTLQYGACALHSSCLWLQTKTQCSCQEQKLHEYPFMLCLCTLPLPVLFLNQSQSHDINANLMFWIANSTKQTYFCFGNRIQPKICYTVNSLLLLPIVLTSHNTWLHNYFSLYRTIQVEHLPQQCACFPIKKYYLAICGVNCLCARVYLSINYSSLH